VAGVRQSGFQPFSFATAERVNLENELRNGRARLATVRDFAANAMVQP
jgi:hypothetical protein